MKIPIPKLPIIANDYLEPKDLEDVHTSSAKMGPKPDTTQKV